MQWTLASGITLGRLLFVPLLLFFLLQGERLIAFGLLLLVLLGDLVDGALARLRREVTDLGKLLDPVVDKVVFIAVFVALVWIGDLSWIALLFLAVLQIGMVIGVLLWLKRRRAAPSARPWGKSASFVLSMGLLAALLGLPYYEWVTYGGVVLAYGAGLDYLFTFLRAAREEAQTPLGQER
jgi:phosphatidylglycerophosphate synthase